MGKRVKQFLSVLFGRKIVLISAIVILFFAFCAIASPLMAPCDPYEQDLSNRLAGASREHWLGTDQLGRDLYSRIVYGTRVAFLVGILAVFIAAALGCAIGLISGYFGGWVDNILMRIMEAQMAIPPLILALALVAVFGRSVPMLIFVLGISAIPGFARMMRGQVLSIREMDYIAASRIRGNSNLTTMIRHIFPNCLSPIIVIMTQSIGGTILAEAGMSFLGAGIVPPTASWGAMVNAGYSYIYDAPLFALAPGIAIILLVLAFNIFGDGLRDALDPRLRGTI
ncbi:MAG: ABC transporter permease [bacterium]|nr:ABC transporter permease [Roseburia sp.]MCM1098216.1 ABC transporter permease [Ruminococcus flavefaciens]MCM1190043.1 ABC transporter permease [bacterium]